MSVPLYQIMLSQRFRGMPDRVFFEPDDKAAEAFSALDPDGAFLVGFEVWIPSGRGGDGIARRTPLAISLDHIVTMRPASPGECAKYAAPAFREPADVERDERVLDSQGALA